MWATTSRNLSVSSKWGIGELFSNSTHSETERIRKMVRQVTKMMKNSFVNLVIGSSISINMVFLVIIVLKLIIPLQRIYTILLLVM